MKYKGFAVMALIALLVVAGWAVQGRQDSPGPLTGSGGPLEAASGAEQAVPVEAVAVQRRTIARTLTYHGVLQPSRIVRLSLPQGGRVEAVHVDVGDPVEEGAVLLQLESDELRARLRQAEAGVAAATAQLERLLAGATAEELRQLRAAVRQAEAERDNARQEYERMERLLQSGAVTGQTFDAARARLRAAESAVEAAIAQLERVQRGASEHDVASMEAQLHQAEAARDLAQVHLDYATLTSPVRGVVSERSVEPGETASPGVPVLTIASLDELRVPLRLSGRDVVHLQPGAPVGVVVEDLPHLSYEGRIHRIDPVAEPQSNLFGVDVRVPNPDGVLRAGLYATVRIPYAVASSSLAVPERAVAEWEGQPGVYVAEGGRARFQPLTFGLSDGHWREVTDEGALREGDLVITAGREFVRPGSPVRVRDEAAAPGGEGAAR